MLQIFRKNSKKEIGFKPTLIVFTAPSARYLFDGGLFLLDCKSISNDVSNC